MGPWVPSRLQARLGAVLGIFGALCWELLAKLGRKWMQDDRSWVQDGVKSRPRWTMMSPRGAVIAPRWGMIAPRWAFFELNFGASGAVLGAFFEDFRRWVGKRKTLKNFRFSLVFGTFGRLGRGV